MKKQIKKNGFKSMISLLVFATFLAACSHKPVVTEFDAMAVPSEEISRLDRDITVGVHNQLDLLSTSNFKKAQDLLADAKNSLLQDKTSKVTLHYVAEGRAYLDLSNKVADTARDNFIEIINARQDAVSSGAPEIFPDKFQSADKKFNKMIGKIESDDLDEALKNRSALQLVYLDLEVDSIKEVRLGNAKKTVSIAEDEGAKKFAPNTLARAKASIDETEAFIAVNRHFLVKIKERADRTNKEADRLLRITRDAKKGKNESSEARAVSREEEKEKLAAKEEEVLEQGEMLVAGERAIQGLSNENDQLASKNAANTAFKNAGAGFTKDEADVYRRGDSLVIRLKGLKFSNSQSTLAGRSVVLLSKVQDVLNDFGSSNVVIEGHTDSVGGKALNKRISMERANTVKDYLVSVKNKEQLVENIHAVGVDYQKPVATNKTSNGRAQNRRVDVIISPNSIDQI